MTHRMMIGCLTLLISAGAFACGGGEDAGSLANNGDANQNDAQNQNQNQNQNDAQNQNQNQNGEDVSGLPALGDGTGDIGAVEVTTIADTDDGLMGPHDLEFNPESPDQLWIVNRIDNSVVIAFDPGTDDQTSEKYAAPGNNHYLPNVVALAFGEPGFMATAQQTDEPTQPETPHDFMGPTLWPTDLDLFDGGHASHMDMLHNSPLGSGIAWDDGIAFWYFDAYHGSLTHYDFVEDHGPGGADHSDGVVHRYADGEVSGVDEVVSHLAFDRGTDLLYVADTGNNRLAILDAQTGEVGGPISPNYDGSVQNYVDGAELTTLLDGADEGWSQPAGLELHDGVLFLTDAANSVIYAYETDGEFIDSLDVSSVIASGDLMGLALDDEDRIYAADSGANAIVRFAPKDD